MKIDVDVRTTRLERALDRAPGVVMRHVDRNLLRGAIEFTGKARRNAAKGRGGLVRMIGFRRLGLADFMLESTAGHARYVEEGTGPGGTPPLLLLLDWMRVRGVAEPGSDDERRKAFLISRSIRKKGTPAQPYMAPALKTMRPRLRDLVRQGGVRGMREALR